MKIQHQEDPNSTTLVANKPFLLRSLFTVGALARHFDFDLEEFKGTNKVDNSLFYNVHNLKLKVEKVVYCNDYNYFLDCITKQTLMKRFTATTAYNQNQCRFCTKTID